MDQSFFFFFFFFIFFFFFFFNFFISNVWCKSTWIKSYSLRNSFIYKRWKLTKPHPHTHTHTHAVTLVSERERLPAWFFSTELKKKKKKNDRLFSRKVGRFFLKSTNVLFRLLGNCFPLFFYCDRLRSALSQGASVFPLLERRFFTQSFCIGIFFLILMHCKSTRDLLYSFILNWILKPKKQKKRIPLII